MDCKYTFIGCQHKIHTCMLYEISRAYNEEERVTSSVRVPGGNLSVCLNL